MPASRHAVSGALCWVSLMSRDLQATQDFYRAVLGWTYRASPLGEEYAVALSGGSAVAGIGAVASRYHNAVAWIPYFAVDNADATAARIRERGATVAVGPLTMNIGRAALGADPQGATFGFWEGETAADWSVGRGGAPAHLELRTRDALAAAIFYGEVLLWASGRGGHEVRYTENNDVLLLDGEHVVATLRGGALESIPDPQVRPHWLVHFRVPDVDRAVADTEAAGGSVVDPPSPAGDGRRATLRDPDGGVFVVTDLQHAHGQGGPHPARTGVLP